MYCTSYMYLVGSLGPTGYPTFHLEDDIIHTGRDLFPPFARKREGKRERRKKGKKAVVWTSLPFLTHAHLEPISFPQSVPPS